MILKDWMRKANIVIDTGALLEYYKLLLEASIKKSPKEKFKLFSDFLENKKLYVVPQVFAEIYSLLKRDAKKVESKLIYWLGQLRDHFRYLIEDHVSKDEILEDHSFLKFGFTDIALSKIINKEWILLSTDQPLINYRNSKGLEAHHIEEIYIF